MLTSKSFINVIETNMNFPQKINGKRRNMKSYNDTKKLFILKMRETYRQKIISIK